jgi:hypothetical protein
MILILISLVSSAKDPIVIKPRVINKPVVCSDPKTVIEGLTEESGEQPFWSGATEKTKYILLVNPKTRTWSMVEYTDKTACVLDMGKDSSQILLGNMT